MGKFIMNDPVNLNYNLGRANYNKEGLEDNSSLLFNNLIWLTTKEAAVYLRRSVNSIHTLVSRRQLRARRFCNRLYFKKEEIDYLIETSLLKGG